MESMFFAMLLLVGMTAALPSDLTVCRQGQTVTIAIQDLSAYDEIGACVVSDIPGGPIATTPGPFYNPNAAPSTSPSSAPSQPLSAEPNVTLAQPNATLTQPNATLAQPNATLAQPNATLAQPNATLAQPNATLAQPNATLTQPTATPTSAGAAALASNSTASSNPIHPTTQTDAAGSNPLASPTLQQGAAQPDSHSMLSAMESSTMNNNHAPGVHNDGHEWQATGSFRHGHMSAVIRSNGTRVLPASMDPTDPRSRVFVYLQWFSPESVYDKPGTVFLLFAKAQGAGAPSSMRIN